MIDIYKYEIINPIVDKQRPFLNRDGLFYVPLKGTNYKYFLECTRFNPIYKNKEYFILFGKDKFNINCRKCSIDMYGRYKLNLKGEIKTYIDIEANYNTNIDINYVESETEYDVFQLN